MSGLKEYCSIYLYIKKTNTPLFQLIEDTCTDYLFKFRFITFLMPNSTLLNKMKKEKPSVAAKMIKSLILKGSFKNTSELTGDVINIAYGKLSKLSDLKAKPDPKFIQWEGYDNLSVLLYEGTDVPPATEQERKSKSVTPKKVIIEKKTETKKPEAKKSEKKVSSKTKK